MTETSLNTLENNYNVSQLMFQTSSSAVRCALIRSRDVGSRRPHAVSSGIDSVCQIRASGTVDCTSNAPISAAAADTRAKPGPLVDIRDAALLPASVAQPPSMHRTPIPKRAFGHPAGVTRRSRHRGRTGAGGTAD